MKNKFKIFSFIFCITFIFSLFSIVTSADSGPKPSVRINFENMGEELCYGTLLSKNPSTGPQSAWDGDEEHIYKDNDLPLDIWRAFVDYKDSDGYYFLQIAWQVNEKHELAWTYYPPESFKILLYYPETKSFRISEICEAYAFDTYYTVDMQGVNLGSVDYNEELSNNDRLVAYKSYQWRTEAISLILRIVITIALEMCVAFLFGFREKRALILLVAVNVATQIALNIILNFINFTSGEAAFVAGYIMLEIAIFAIEAMIYSSFMKKLSKKARSKRFYIVYSFLANGISFISGLALALVIPGIF